jgi:hypothetical protein
MDIYRHSPIRLHSLRRDNLQFELHAGECVVCAPINLALCCDCNYHPWGLHTILTLIYVMPAATQQNTNTPDCYQLYLIEQVNVYFNTNCKTWKYRAYSCRDSGIVREFMNVLSRLLLVSANGATTIVKDAWSRLRVTHQGTTWEKEFRIFVRSSLKFQTSMSWHT